MSRQQYGMFPDEPPRPRSPRMYRLILSFALCLFALLPFGQGLAEPLVERVEPMAVDGRLLIDADVEFRLTDELRGFAEKGVPLYLTADLQITRSRWWWFDKTVVSTELTWRVQYNALTRQWRVGTGDLSMPASTLDEALDLVRYIRGWDVASTDELETDTQYEGQLRLRLDTARLARPFQVDALNSKAWSLTTPWKNFTFSISVAAPRP
ncbi:DUF4390 domain-containing protein [Castellaniella sp. S9]|uniref:DUF4390 domain-containing protein n=1 Tax=Castellaniella sp. S9 TaxID=2993652 RepID=UPI0022B5153A|nr:DUF4390 domain-containing protein [Castellaniella sp. S9]